MSESTESVVENAAAENKPEAPAKTKSGGCGAVFFAVFLSVAASGALVVGSPYWTPYAETYAGIPGPLKGVENENARLGRAVADLETKSAAVVAEQGKLKEQTAAAVGGVRAASLALANAQLRAKLASGESFEYELAVVAAAAKGDAEVAPLLASLEPFAAAGAPTKAALRESFPLAVGAVVAAEAETAAKSANGWLGSLSALAGQLGYVLQVTTAPEGGVHAMVRQARVRLSAGDLAGAVDELSTLPEPRAQDAALWIDGAKARIAADKADGALTTLILARLTASK